MFCINCGTKLPDDAKFCMTCGTKIISFDKQQKQSINNCATIPINSSNSVGKPIEFIVKGKKIQFDGSFRQYTAERLRFCNSFYSFLLSLEESTERSFQRCIESDKDKALGVIAELGNTIISWVLDWEMNFLIQNNIYDISKELLAEKCHCYLDDFYDFYNQFEEGYLAIVANEEEMAEYRRLRHAARGRWEGGGFGLSGAIKGATMAGVLNLGGTILSGIGTAISGVIDSSIISSKKKKYLTSKDWINECCSSLIDCTELMHDEAYRLFAIRKGITFPPLDLERGHTYLENSQMAENVDHAISIILMGLNVNPFIIAGYELLFRFHDHLEYDLCRFAEYFLPKFYWEALYSDIWETFSENYEDLSDNNSDSFDLKIDFAKREINFLKTYRGKSIFLDGYTSKYLDMYLRILQADELKRRTAKDGTVLNSAEERDTYDIEQERYSNLKSALSSAKSLTKKFEVLAAARNHGFRSTVITAEIEEEYNTITSLLHSKTRIETLKKSLQASGDAGINDLVKIAKTGDADAIFLLGELFLNGKHVKKDEKVAFNFFSMAAKMHHLEAKAYLGHCYLTGSGVEEDMAKAYALLKETADKGSTFAQARLGILILSGEGSEIGLPEDQSNTDTGLCWLNMAAEQGDSEAQCFLARNYVLGECVDTNYELALSWLEKAMRNNYAPAYCDLAAMFNQGLGVPQDSQKTILLLKKAIELDDDPEIKLALAQAYGDLERYDDAIKLYYVCAKAGCAVAFGKIGHMYQHGLGRDQNIGEAIKWFKAGAEKGDALSQRRLGILYQNGSGVANNYLEAAKWYRMGAENEDAVCQYYLGLLYENGLGVSQDYTEAAKWYQMGAENEDSDCQHNLGYLYMKGLGVSQDNSKAAYWFQRGAELGNHNCEYWLAVMYEEGKGVPQNYSIAAKWYQKGADSGDRFCQTRLAVLYTDGHGVTKNYQIAAQLYQKAIQQGDKVAMNNLALMYENGQGVPKDHKKALRLLEDAIAAGNEQAARNYKKIKRIFD